jgi:ferredoxin/flavodoxin---NADP+ reductase
MSSPGHCVAIIGGAVAGSEAAFRLSERNIRCVVFEQNALPYGKLETGLPKWHISLRDSQEEKIDSKLRHPLIHYVPCTRLGKDLLFTDLVQNWGFSAVLLATGAWQDRPLPIPGIDDFINKGLYYQNPFVAWFNQNHDPAYAGPRFEISDGTCVIGGGLASLDVIKILAIETVRLLLEKHGHDVDTLTIERRGIFEVLQELNLSISALGLHGCTLYYRRRLIDMPLTELPDQPEQKALETAYRVRKKIMDNFQKKYFFNFVECHQPVDFIAENNRLAGLVFEKTALSGETPTAVAGSRYGLKSPLTISAIGSLPEPVEERIYKVKDAESGQLEGFENVFVLGNAVTGRGNIKESQMHGRRVSEKVMDEYLAWREEDYQEIFARAEVNAGEKIGQIQQRLAGKKLRTGNQIAVIQERVLEYQRKAGYDGDYNDWIKRHVPVRLEQLLRK